MDDFDGIDLLLSELADEPALFSDGEKENEDAVPSFVPCSPKSNASQEAAEADTSPARAAADEDDTLFTARARSPSPHASPPSSPPRAASPPLGSPGPPAQPDLPPSQPSRPMQRPEVPTRPTPSATAPKHPSVKGHKPALAVAESGDDKASAKPLAAAERGRAKSASVPGPASAPTSKAALGAASGAAPAKLSRPIWPPVPPAATQRAVPTAKPCTTGHDSTHNAGASSTRPSASNIKGGLSNSASGASGQIAANTGGGGLNARATTGVPGAKSARGMASGGGGPPRVPVSSHRPPAMDLVDKRSGLRVKNRLLPSLVQEERFSLANFCQLGDVCSLLYGQKDGVDDLATIGVLSHKTPTKESASGNRFMVWSLSDLKGARVSLFLFGAAYEMHWKESVGAVVGLVGAAGSTDARGTSLKVTLADQLFKIGTSVDFAVCAGTTKDGRACSVVINRSEGEYCQYHVINAYKQLQAKQRMELKGSNLATGFTLPGSSQRGAKRGPAQTINSSSALRAAGVYSFNAEGSRPAKPLSRPKTAEELVAYAGSDKMRPNSVGARYLKSVGEQAIREQESEIARAAKRKREDADANTHGQTGIRNQAAAAASAAKLPRVSPPATSAPARPAADHSTQPPPRPAANPAAHPSNQGANRPVSGGPSASNPPTSKHYAGAPKQASQNSKEKRLAHPGDSGGQQKAPGSRPQFAPGLSAVAKGPAAPATGSKESARTGNPAPNERADNEGAGAGIQRGATVPNASARTAGAASKVKAGGSGGALRAANDGVRGPNGGDASGVRAPGDAHQGGDRDDTRVGAPDGSIAGSSPPLPRGQGRTAAAQGAEAPLPGATTGTPPGSAACARDRVGRGGGEGNGDDDGGSGGGDDDDDHCGGGDSDDDELDIFMGDGDDGGGAGSDGGGDGGGEDGPGAGSEDGSDDKYGDDNGEDGYGDKDGSAGGGDGRDGYSSEGGDAGADDRDGGGAGDIDGKRDKGHSDARGGSAEKSQPQTSQPSSSRPSSAQPQPSQPKLPQHQTPSQPSSTKPQTCPPRAPLRQAPAAPSPPMPSQCPRPPPQPQPSQPPVSKSQGPPQAPRGGASIERNAGKITASTAAAAAAATTRGAAATPENANANTSTKANANAKANATAGVTGPGKSSAANASAPNANAAATAAGLTATPNARSMSARTAELPNARTKEPDPLKAISNARIRRVMSSLDDAEVADLKMAHVIAHVKAQGGLDAPQQNPIRSRDFVPRVPLAAIQAVRQQAQRAPSGHQPADGSQRRGPGGSRAGQGGGPVSAVEAFLAASARPRDAARDSQTQGEGNADRDSPRPSSQGGTAHQAGQSGPTHGPIGRGEGGLEGGGLGSAVPHQTQGVGGGEVADVGKQSGSKRAFMAAFGDVAAAALARSRENGSDLMAMADEVEDARRSQLFDLLEKKEEMVTKMEGITKMMVPGWRCCNCNVTTERKPFQCVASHHVVKAVKEAVKRWFDCRGCKRKVTTLDAHYPRKACGRCGGNDFDRASMFTGPKAAPSDNLPSREGFKPRGEEHAFTLRSVDGAARVIRAPYEDSCSP
eukprot:jgi/Mesvir1/15618/Mv03225-RA.1